MSTEIEEIVYFKSEDMRVKDPNARLQAMILKLKGNQALILSHRADYELWRATYPLLTEQTKLLLLEQVRRGLGIGSGGTAYGITCMLECFLPDMVMKQGLPPPPPPATGIMGLTIATRRKKAKDPKTSAEDLKILMTDPDDVVKDNLLTNKSMPLDTIVDHAHKCIASLVADDDRSWQHTKELSLIAKNEAAPVDLLEEIVTIDWHSWAYDFRGNALNNKSFPLDYFEKLSKHKSKQVRDVLAECSKTPDDILKKLCNDKDCSVRDAAAATLTQKKGEKQWPR